LSDHSYDLYESGLDTQPSEEDAAGRDSDGSDSTYSSDDFESASSDGYEEEALCRGGTDTQLRRRR